jgi:hypothetical protein
MSEGSARDSQTDPNSDMPDFAAFSSIITRAAAAAAAAAARSQLLKNTLRITSHISYVLTVPRYARTPPAARARGAAAAGGAGARRPPRTYMHAFWYS